AQDVSRPMHRRIGSRPFHRNPRHYLPYLDLWGIGANRGSRCRCQCRGSHRMIGLRRFTRFLGDSRGTAAVEFAFLLAPLMLLIFGTIEVSRLVWVKNVMHEAAISGARCMAIMADGCASSGAFNPAETTVYVQQSAIALGLAIAETDIELQQASGCGNATGFSGVVINHEFKSVVLLLN